MNRANLVRAGFVPLREAKCEDGASARTRDVYAKNKVWKDWIMFMSHNYQLNESEAVYALQCDFAPDRGAQYSGCSPTLTVAAWAPKVNDAVQVQIPIFCLPKHVVLSQYPDFTIFCLGKIRSAKLVPKTGWVVDPKLNATLHGMNFSFYERLETIFGALNGTLSQAFSSGWGPKALAAANPPAAAPAAAAAAGAVGISNQDHHKSNPISISTIQKLALLLLAVNHTACNEIDEPLLWQLHPTNGDYKVKTNLARFSVLETKQPKEKDDKPQLDQQQQLNEEKEVQILIDELLTRDTDPADRLTNRLRRINDTSAIIQFFRKFTLAARANPRVLHMAVWPRLEYFAFGMLLFGLSDEHVENMRATILQAIFNRMLRRIPKYSKECVSEPLTLDALVSGILKNTPSLLSYLRYWAFVVQFCLHVRQLGWQCMVPSAFATVINQLKDSLLTCPSIQAICVAIAPGIGGLYTSETVANLLLSVNQLDANSQENKRFLIIHGQSQIDPKCQTLATQLKGNLAAIDAAQKRIAEQKLKEATDDAKYEKQRQEKDDWALVSKVEIDEKQPVVQEALVMSPFDFFPVNPLAELCQPLGPDGKRRSMEEQLTIFWKNLQEVVTVKHSKDNYQNYASETWRKNEFYANIWYANCNYSCRRYRYPKWCMFAEPNAGTKWCIRAQRTRSPEDIQRLQKQKEEDLRFAKLKAFGKIDEKSALVDEKEEELKDQGVPLQIRPFEPSCVWLHRICILTQKKGQCLICFAENKKLIRFHPTPKEHPNAEAHTACAECVNDISSAPMATCPWCRLPLK